MVTLKKKFISTNCAFVFSLITLLSHRPTVKGKYLKLFCCLIFFLFLFLLLNSSSSFFITKEVSKVSKTLLICVQNWLNFTLIHIDTFFPFFFIFLKYILKKKVGERLLPIVIKTLFLWEHVIHFLVFILIYFSPLCQ